MESLSKAGTLVIMRHGEGEHNLLGTYNSNPKNARYRDVFLTEKGLEDARASAAKLLSNGLNSKNIRTVFFSPLPRTRQTADVVAKVLALPQDLMREEDAIIEVDAGVREGLFYDDFPEHPWDASVFAGPANPDSCEGGGEDDNDVQKRVLRFLERVIALTINSFDRHMIAVTHGTPAKKMIEALTGFPVRLLTSELASFPLNGLQARLDRFEENKRFASSCKADDEFVARKTGERRQLFSLAGLNANKR